MFATYDLQLEKLSELIELIVNFIRFSFEFNLIDETDVIIQHLIDECQSLQISINNYQHRLKKQVQKSQMELQLNQKTIAKNSTNEKFSMYFCGANNMKQPLKKASLNRKPQYKTIEKKNMKPKSHNVIVNRNYHKNELNEQVDRTKLNRHLSQSNIKSHISRDRSYDEMQNNMDQIETIYESLNLPENDDQQEIDILNEDDHIQGFNNDNILDKFNYDNISNAIPNEIRYSLNQRTKSDAKISEQLNYLKSNESQNSVPVFMDNVLNIRELFKSRYIYIILYV